MLGKRKGTWVVDAEGHRPFFCDSEDKALEVMAGITGVKVSIWHRGKRIGFKSGGMNDATAGVIGERNFAADAGAIRPFSLSEYSVGGTMTKYHFEIRYTAEGAKALAVEGGVSRLMDLSVLVNSLEGTMEGFYYAFGDVDLYVIAELPTAIAAAAFALAIGKSGAATVKTTVLLSAQQMDEVISKNIDYRPPGAA